MYLVGEGESSGYANIVATTVVGEGMFDSLVEELKGGPSCNEEVEVSEGG